jgi:enediyne biosynthesis protein E4
LEVIEVSFSEVRSHALPILLIVVSGFAVAQAPPANVPSEKSAIRFEDTTKSSNIDFTHSFGSRKLGSLLESTGAGCVWLDYNNDGRPDLYVVTGRSLEDGIHPFPLKEKPATPPHNHLYRNDGGGKFTDVTEQAGLAPEMYSIAVAAADYDNDGFIDLLVTGYGKAVLYHNRGNGTFEDVTKAAGINVERWSISSTWLDYDRDGCLDLFVGRYVQFDPKYRAFYPADNYPGPLDYEADTNRLFHNDCKGHFSDVTEKSGIAQFKGRTMGVTAADFDGDGWPDIYVANDKTENFLFHNKHDGTFEEIATDAEVAYGQNGESTSAMGPVFADVDGDGVLDLWVTDSKYNRLMHNTGKLRFDDIGPTSGVAQANAQYVSWGSGVFDFDNDGLPDILTFHGGLIHMVPEEPSLFRGVAKGKFQDVSGQAGVVLEVKSVARGACFADYDSDGKVDAFLVNLGSQGTLLHNTSATKNHWIEIQLRGQKSNRDGIGARIELFSEGKRQVAERVAGSGYLSQNDGRVHFGLGQSDKIERIKIRWPSGTEQVLENVSIDRVLSIEEPR